jgi:hypothetical protein
MKRLFKSKKGIALLATLVVAAAGAVAGYAYFTASGSGTGTAHVGTASSIAITGSVASDLYPGYSQAFPITVSNPGAGHQYVGTVTLSGVVPSLGGTNNSANCTPGDFTMAPVPVTTDIAATSAVTVTGTLAMTDAATSQNGCQNNSLALSFTSG